MKYTFHKILHAFSEKGNRYEKGRNIKLVIRESFILIIHNSYFPDKVFLYLVLKIIFFFFRKYKINTHGIVLVLIHIIQCC